MRNGKSDLNAINEALKRAKDPMETLALALPYMVLKSADARTFPGSQRTTACSYSCILLCLLFTFN